MSHQFFHLVEKLTPVQTALLVVGLFFFGPIVAAFVLAYRIVAASGPELFGRSQQ